MFPSLAKNPLLCAWTNRNGKNIELHFTEPGVWWEGDEAGVTSWGDGTHLSPQLHFLLMFPHWWHSLQS